jgi:predicted AlkP superfamily phosphohydrolase/phosphomutase
MKQVDGKRVLVIGIDAAEPTLVRRLIEQGELPALKNLLEGGAWHRVDSPARLGSGAVWPTFFTGTGPTDHGMYSRLSWDPETMSLRGYHGYHLTPFWESLRRSGTIVGVLDVPFAPFVGLSKGFEISEWGAHDVVEGRTKVSPATLLDIAMKATRPHPFSLGQLYVAGPEDYRGLTKLSSACLAGVQLRGSLGERLISEIGPELTIIVFPEIHRAAHYLWHTIAPEHHLYQREMFREGRVVHPTLLDIYREVDRQIARLVEAGGSEATVLVFSLHGMQPTRGRPTILGPLLRDLGLARLTDWGTRPWAEHAQSGLAMTKRYTPPHLKRIYHNVVPQPVRRRVTRQTMLPAYDWSRTRAFSLPTDQHGWIRLNVLGREAKGIVSSEQYDQTCDLLEDALRALTTKDGRPLVRDVLRLSNGSEEALLQRLPDLVIHWHAAALESPVRVKNSSLRAYPQDTQLTGQHSPDGFCIIRSSSDTGSDSSIGESIAAKDLHRLIIAALTASPGDNGPCGTADAR